MSDDIVIAANDLHPFLLLNAEKPLCYLPPPTATVQKWRLLPPIRHSPT
jgi:hypothetical protein